MQNSPIPDKRVKNIEQSWIIHFNILAILALRSPSLASTARLLTLNGNDTCRTKTFASLTPYLEHRSVAAPKVISGTAPDTVCWMEASAIFE